jgi:hypothetical protein
MAGHWYRIEVVAGGETHCYFGSSAFAERDLVQRIQTGEFVLLDQLTYYDEDGDARPWTEWDPAYLPRIHLNPRFVVSILPLSGDPRNRDREGSVVLNYPGVPSVADED